jgi:hypothetical protein
LKLRSLKFNGVSEKRITQRAIAEFAELARWLVGEKELRGVGRPYGA